MTASHRLLVAASGSVAVLGLHSLLLQLRGSGCDLRLVLTRNAARFVSAEALQHIVGSPVLGADPEHELLNPASVVADRTALLIAPASAATLSRLAAGHADSLLAGCYLNAGERPVLVAPAMGHVMLEHPAVRRNLRMLEADGVHVLEGPGGLELSSGEWCPTGGLPTAAQVLTALSARARTRFQAQETAS